jgi:hypothetical protein
VKNQGMSDIKQPADGPVGDCSKVFEDDDLANILNGKGAWQPRFFIITIFYRKVSSIAQLFQFKLGIFSSGAYANTAAAMPNPSAKSTSMLLFGQNRSLLSARRSLFRELAASLSASYASASYP